MKKRLLITALMGLSAGYVQAQTQPVELGWHHQYGEKDTLRSFTVINGTQDYCIDRLYHSFNAPDEQVKTGLFSWKGINIPGLADNVTIEVRDGIMERDTVARKAYWKPFENKKDKEESLSRITQTTRRDMTIVFKDAKGNNILNTAAKEDLAKAFLLSKL